MNIEYLNPNSLQIDMLRYAQGDTNEYPNVTGIHRKHVTIMTRMRRTFIRNLLTSGQSVRAHTLPDFNQLMAEEIWKYAKRELRPVLFRDWELRIGEMPRFSEIFYREDSRLHREYKDAVDQNKPYIKHRYLSITAKREAFRLAVTDAYILGEIECACFGTVRYGLL